jgi:hypothetical protein
MLEPVMLQASATIAYRHLSKVATMDLTVRARFTARALKSFHKHSQIGVAESNGIINYYTIIIIIVRAAVGNPDAAVVTAPGRISLPERSIVSGDNPSDGDFVTLVRKKRAIQTPVNTAAAAAAANTFLLTYGAEPFLRSHKIFG